MKESVSTDVLADVLKGHDFSRAETLAQKLPGFSRCGMYLRLKPIPQGLKAALILRSLRHE
jgi:hypothetical protein